jgi:hypothetical protein
MPRPEQALAEMVRVCRPGGRIVVNDATPRPDAQGLYDRLETLRDRSHASALTLDQLRALGRAAGLEEAVVDGHRLEAELADLADPQDMAALEAMLDADIASGEDRTDLGPRRTNGRLVVRFPISIVAWRR